MGMIAWELFTTSVLVMKSLGINVRWSWAARLTSTRLFSQLCTTRAAMHLEPHISLGHVQALGATLRPKAKFQTQASCTVAGSRTVPIKRACAAGQSAFIAHLRCHAQTHRPWRGSYFSPLQPGGCKKRSIRQRSARGQNLRYEPEIMLRIPSLSNEHKGGRN